MTVLLFDVCVFARHLPLTRELALACPDTQFVLVHYGVPDIVSGGLDPWRDDLRWPNCRTPPASSLASRPLRPG